jgi:hypothetical protein
LLTLNQTHDSCQKLTLTSENQWTVSVPPQSTTVLQSDHIQAAVHRHYMIHDPSFIRTDIAVKALTADRDGFSLNAAVFCQSYQRDRLERLYWYVTRPAICLERLKVRADGQIQYELKHPFSRGRRRTAPLTFCFLPWIS